MSHTKEILSLTQELEETIDSHDANQALEIVSEIQQFLEAHSVEDAAYYELTEDIEKVEHTLSDGDLSSDDWIEISVVGYQIDELYLRHHRQEEDSKKSLSTVRAERDIFREKAIRCLQDIDELVDHTEDIHEELRKKSKKIGMLQSLLENKQKRQKERIDQTVENLIGSPEDDIISKLKKSKEKIQNDERDEAQKLLRDVRQVVEDKQDGSPLVARLQMAESDVKLGRTSILDDIISKLEGEYDQSLEGIDSALETAGEEFNEGLPDDPTDLTKHDPED